MHVVDEGVFWKREGILWRRALLQKNINNKKPREVPLPPSRLPVEDRPSFEQSKTGMSLSLS
jgi:hypothetical protein